MFSDSLDIDQSLMQARWVFPSFCDDTAARMVRQYGIPDMVARLLSARNIGADEVESFLFPRLGRDFPDPLSMTGMEELAVYLAQAVIDRRKIAVFGDFDVDGATSTAILVRFLRHFGMDAPFYIPDRLNEGYGPNAAALKSLKEQGAEIVILCDCGITAHDVIAQGRDCGLEIVVCDHHETEDSLPPANHVVNPKRPDDTSGLEMLAACGVVFLMCVAVNARLREEGYFEKNGMAEPPLKSWLDIVALGTVCDMVPLTGVNRLFVKTGFSLMANTLNPGLQALCDVAGVKGAPSTYHAGFALGPRINAGSRVHQADLGARLLSTDDPQDARDIAWMLEDCNKKRKGIQAEMFEHAVGIVEADGLHEKPVIVVGHEDWHPGLSGLVAGRLKEKYGKPAVCITYAPGEKGRLEGRGSGRSVAGVNLGGAFIDARTEGILEKGGGHAMAAGFTLDPANLDAFETFLTSHITRQMAGQRVVTETPVDAVLSVRGAQLDMVRMLEDHFGPFGQAHEEPVFVLPHVRLHNVGVVGRDHVRAMISDWEGGSRLKAIAFRSADTPLGEALLKNGTSQPFHIAGHFKINHWQGRDSVEMHIKDAAYALKSHETPKVAAGS